MQEDQSAVALYETKDQETTKPVVIDALPYVDVVHEDYEQYALSLIEDEMKTMKAPKMKALAPPKFSSSNLLRSDYESLSKNPDQKPFELSNRAQEPSVQTVEAWRKAVKNAKAEYEAERQRSVVLEIEKSDASQYQWKQYGTMLENLEKESLERVESKKAAVDKLNVERQQHQEKAGQRIQLLSSQWNGAIKKRMQLQVAARDLKAQVESLKGAQSKNEKGSD